MARLKVALAFLLVPNEQVAEHHLGDDSRQQHIVYAHWQDVVQYKDGMVVGGVVVPAFAAAFQGSWSMENGD